MSTQFTNDQPEVLGKINQATDLMMGLMAAGIETQIKTSGNTPIDKGNLRSSARSVKVGDNHYEVQDSANYAAPQEVGHRTTKSGEVVEFKNHPRGGGAGYFQKAIDTTMEREQEYAQTASKAVGLETL